jgi:predicted O-methyltransferase YrrM
MQAGSDFTPATETSGRKLPSVRQITRWIVRSPLYLIRFVLLLPYRLIKFLIYLPRNIWRAWTRGALLIVKVRYGLKKLWYWRRESIRLLRVHDPPGRFRHWLVLTLHPRRFQHCWRVLRTKLNPSIWDAHPDLSHVLKAIKWAHEYNRHRSRFQDIDAIRSILYARNTVAEDQPLRPAVGYIGRRISVRKRWGALLHGLVRYSQAQRVLELGTGYGISSLYIARGLLDNYPIRTCMLITLEQEPERARAAREHLYQLGLDDFATVTEGDIQNTLDRALQDIHPLNIAFMDGPEEENLVLRSFAQIKRHSRPGTFVVLTNIHASADMHRAWLTMKDMRQVAATVDLWHWGIVLIGDSPAAHIYANL